MKHIRSTFFLLTTLFIMASCGEDRSGEYYALVGENLMDRANNERALFMV